jgi:uncharacterized membrane protein YbaN (DUF454 family)
MLTTSRTFGPLLAVWQAEGAIPTWAKVLAIVMMAATLIGSLCASLSGWIIAIQLTCMTAAAGFILSRPVPATERDKPLWKLRR